MMNEQVMLQTKGLDPVLLRRGSAILALAMAVGLGDWLFWGHVVGASLAAFLAGVGILHLILNWQRTTHNNAAVGLVLLFAALIPPLESSEPLNWLIGLVGTFVACMIFRGKLPKDLSRRIDVIVTAGLNAVFRFPRFAWIFAKTGESGKAGRSLVGWIVPALFALTFVFLFQQANPIWEKWLAALDIEALLNMIFNGRVLFWVALAWLAWPFLESRFPYTAGLSNLASSFKVPVDMDAESPKAPNVVFFERCLILFNLVFAAQTLLDLTYLWSGAELPDGMSYASYAHRGAYPLVAAALLAGLFVVVAMRPGGAGEISKTVKWLVLLWVGQNIMLVSSSLLRLDLYVGVFGLTYWRVAAFLWMALVGLGLILIVARFLSGKTSSWLISTNILSLCGFLYVISLVNLPGVIAAHNLKVERFYSSAPAIDWHYLRWLGPAAYPAAVAARKELLKQPQLPHVVYRLRRFEKYLAQQVVATHDRDWREWGFRNQRSHWAYKKEQFRPTEDRTENKTEDQREKQEQTAP